MIIAIFTIVVTLVLILASPWIVSLTIFKSITGLNSSYEVGSAIGGITAPIVAFAAAILMFLSFWSQYQANKKQSEWLKKQEEKQEFDRLEMLISKTTDYKVFSIIPDGSGTFKDLCNHLKIELEQQNYQQALGTVVKIEEEVSGINDFIFIIKKFANSTISDNLKSIIFRDLKKNQEKNRYKYSE